jgi:hypothetical protein
MGKTLKATLAAILATSALVAAPQTWAHGGDRWDRDWRPGPRYDDGWRHRHHHGPRYYRERTYVYSEPAYVVPAPRYIYREPTYIVPPRPPGISIGVDLPRIVVPF